MATTPRIAHGIFTWQDGRAALEPCLRSTAPHVDEILIADGLIDGVDPGDLPWLSDLGWLQDATWLPSSVPVNGKQWKGLSHACTWLLDSARALGCEWLLFVDADQELHHGERLREWLHHWPADAFPLSRADPVGRHPVPWQCVRVDAFERYLAGCYVLQHRTLGPVSLIPEHVREMLPAGAPWLSHHPERRPPGRQEKRLGMVETMLEPPPPAITLPIPSLLP